MPNWRKKSWNAIISEKTPCPLKNLIVHPLSNYLNKKDKLEPLNLLPFLGRLWQIDRSCAQISSSYKCENKEYLLAVDYLSKYIELSPISKNKTC